MYRMIKMISEMLIEKWNKVNRVNLFHLPISQMYESRQVSEECF